MFCIYHCQFKKWMLFWFELWLTKSHLDLPNIFWIEFIHSNLVSCSLIGPLINTWSVLKMTTALRILGPDCRKCLWCMIACMIVKSTDHFFQWEKLLIFFMISSILSHFIYNFHEHEQMILFICLVWIRSIQSCCSRND